MASIVDNPLGAFLRDRRARLDPSSLGIPVTRRRTPGLRREEVAQRANVSATWYTWLEQGRGGSPSEDVLERLSRALVLNDVEREHLFLLAQQRPPQVRFEAHGEVSPRLQRVLDSFEFSAAYIKTSTWDIVAWNHAATVVLADYGALAPRDRNILRLMFSNPHVREAQANWETTARFIVATFRADIARVGAAESVRDFIEEMCASSESFATLWRDNDVRSHGEGTKQLNHRTLGPIALEYSAFSVDGQPDLSMVVYSPATTHDAVAVRDLITSSR